MVFDISIAGHNLVHIGLHPWLTGVVLVLALAWAVRRVLKKGRR
jgi:hypothetical protein